MKGNKVCSNEGPFLSPSGNNCEIVHNDDFKKFHLLHKQELSFSWNETEKNYANAFQDSKHSDKPFLNARFLKTIKVLDIHMMSQ